MGKDKSNRIKLSRKEIMQHPHPNKKHVMESYRKFLLQYKKFHGSARALIHYRDMIQIYLEAKRQYLKEK